MGLLDLHTEDSRFGTINAKSKDILKAVDLMQIDLLSNIIF